MSQKTLVDLSKLRQSTLSDRDFMDKMIQVFVEHTPTDLTAMIEAISKHNLERVSQIAHKLKPSIDHMAIKEMQNQVRLIEAADDSDGNLFVVADDFCQNIEQLIQQLKQEL
jgi:HPt (histidine-containing phosphotransfer) domain-containing protein